MHQWTENKLELVDEEPNGMPLFEFVCQDCAGEFELLTGPRETPECPQCGSRKMEKLMSVSAGRVASGKSLPVVPSACPPPSHGPCGPGCCRLP